MIRVEVDDYCQNCLEFEPDVSKPDVMWIGDQRVVFAGDIVVRCEHRDRCREIADNIIAKLKEQTE